MTCIGSNKNKNKNTTQVGKVEGKSMSKYILSSFVEKELKLGSDLFIPAQRMSVEGLGGSPLPNCC